jgi:hypothetical protein
VHLFLKFSVNVVDACTGHIANDAIAQIRPKPCRSPRPILYSAPAGQVLLGTLLGFRSQAVIDEMPCGFLTV